MSPVEATAPLQSAAPLFAALGDETRLGLLVRLCSGGPLSITRLSLDSTVSRQAVTKHLHVLSEAGWVRSSRCGRESLWEMEPQRFDDAHHYLQRLSRLWDDALGRLKSFVEG